MDNAKKGYIMQIQPFSVNDGDGIRTTIFMAGCPLRCKWCANPEGFSAAPLVGWHRRKCIGCGACAKICPQGIGIDMSARVQSGGKMIAENETGSVGKTGHEICIACGRCADVCPAEARTRMVTLMDADDVLRQIQKHRLFYSYSGGGITFSGGEATSQPEFLDYLTREIYDMGYSMDIETCGMFDWDRVAPILERMDLIFMDLKMMDPEKHREYTGVSNEVILQNIANLSLLGSKSGIDTERSDRASARNALVSSVDEEGQGPQIVIRIPVIGGVNDDEENIRSSAAYVHRHLPNARIEVLPYHSLGAVKYEALGIPYDHPEFTRPSAEELEHLRELIRAEGVETADFR